MEFQALLKYEVTETKYELWQIDLMMMTYLIIYHDDDAPDLHFYQTARKQKNTSRSKKQNISRGPHFAKEHNGACCEHHNRIQVMFFF